MAPYITAGGQERVVGYRRGGARFGLLSPPILPMATRMLPNGGLKPLGRKGLKKWNKMYATKMATMVTF